MVTLLNGAAAFLQRDGKYLLMKRAADRKLVPGVWSGIGGKMEARELNNPYATCLREVYEETGITEAAISNLTLRYIIIRRSSDTIRQSYIYFGDVSADPSLATDEGELHWIPYEQLLKRTFSTTFTAMLKHFVYSPVADKVVIGVAENSVGRCQMMWATVEDFDQI